VAIMAWRATSSAVTSALWRICKLAAIAHEARKGVRSRVNMSSNWSVGCGGGSEKASAFQGRRASQSD
jgi:hypothetical protein